MGSVTQLGFNYLQLFGSVKEEDWPYVSGTTGQWHKYHGGQCRMCSATRMYVCSLYISRERGAGRYSKIVSTIF